MSFSERLKKAGMMTALGASLLFPEAQAKTETEGIKDINQIEQSVKQDWTWRSNRDKAVYESLPPEYKAFAHKNFMERFEMREEWEQRDFLKRDRKRTAILKRNPNATVRDFEPRSGASHLKLANFPTGEGSFWLKITKDEIDGKLSHSQAQMAKELLTMGRPMATINPDLSYTDQLKLCGFDVITNVAGGTKFSVLSARDQSIFIAQLQDAEAVNDQNEEAWRNLRIRLSQEEAEEWEATHSFWDKLFPPRITRVSEEYTKGKFPSETINGKTVLIPQPNEIGYSIHAEVTRKIAAKINSEEKKTAKYIKDNTLSK